MGPGKSAITFFVLKGGGAVSQDSLPMVIVFLISLGSIGFLIVALVRSIRGEGADVVEFGRTSPYRWC